MDFNRILIVRLSAIGDVINTLPALSVLRNNYPKSFIGWVVEDKAKDLLIDHPYLDRVFIFQRKDWQIDLTKPTKLLHITKGLPAFIREIRKGKFDVALDFQGNLKSGVVTYLSGAPMRVGYDKSGTREFNTLFTNYKITPPPSRTNRLSRNLYFLKSLGLDTEKHAVKLPYHAEDETYYRTFARQYLRTGRPLVVFHPGTSGFGSYKRWSPAKYAQLGDLLQQRYSANLIITSGPGEKPLAQEIASQMTTSALINYETNSLNRLAVLLQHTDLFVGSDSAPLHLANLIGTPLIALFGPKDPAIYGPARQHHVVIINKHLDCQPCVKRTCPDPKCMKLITVDDVFTAAQQILAR